MKKMLAVLLAALFLCGIALAETDYMSMPEDAFVSYIPQAGIALTDESCTADLPMLYSAQIGSIDTFGGTCTLISCYGFLREGADRENLQSDDISTARAAYCVVGMNGDITIDCIAELFGEVADGWQEITRIDGHNAFLYTFPSSDYVDELSAENCDLIDRYAYINEAYFKNIVNIPCTSSCVDLTKPLSFSAQSLDCAEVTAEELLAQADYTMFNVWATWCPHCIAEMPALEELNAETENVQIVLICNDVTAEDAESLQEAKDILAENGVTLTCLIGNDEIAAYMVVTGYPATYIYDRDGMYVCRTAGEMSKEEYASWISENIG